ncbi:hypothetical protein BS639_13825 [Rouxiella silvae]|uniref:LysR substrate-binding domain-containing protein n=1 Tax=Rouxiella silvae TaxID=1646373 RepID=A0ABX3U092_9GAMM|nr:hypothetical protein [Rouxiella silvae]ORJ20704.1 hypothetical protein BS639_13825 [Rouxiella silvae]
MELSEAGKFFLVEAQATIDQAQRAIEVAKRAGRGELGEIRIGYVSSALYSGVLSEGVSIVPNILTRKVFLHEVTYPSISAPEITSEINLIYRKWEKSPLIKKFIGDVKER